jgi:hypothetical protein
VRASSNVFLFQGYIVGTRISCLWWNMSSPKKYSSHPCGVA